MTDKQLVSLVDNIISSKTDFDISEFTGGSTIITLTHNNTKINKKISLYFGYSNKKPITRSFEVKDDIFDIWNNAVTTKINNMLQDDRLSLDGLLDSSIVDSSKYLVDSKGSTGSISTSTPTGTPTPKILSDTEIQAERVAKYLYEKILTIQPNLKSNYKSWVKDIDMAIRLDNRCEQSLINCIDWIYSSDKGSFWIPNIKSGKKLREKFDTLEMQSKTTKGAIVANQIPDTNIWDEIEKRYAE